MSKTIADKIMGHVKSKSKTDALMEKTLLNLEYRFEKFVLDTVELTIDEIKTLQIEDNMELLKILHAAFFAGASAQHNIFTEILKEID